MSQTNPISNLPRAFRSAPKTGVLFVMAEAERLGFLRQRDQWANLGQGAPETGSLPGAHARLQNVAIGRQDHEYAPVAGLRPLREAVAQLYNERYRRGERSQYTHENVAICAGGRLALTRLFSVVGHTNVGHFLPDYTAYEELFSTFGTFIPIPILAEPGAGYAFTVEQLEREILGRGLSAILLSNPCNPTGNVIRDDELAGWVHTAREQDCTLIFDEFYSHYIYEGAQSSVSACEHVKDVNRDPVVVIDGLTKNWRYPGLRVSWTVGPKEIIDVVTSAGSYLDGGCSRPMQKAALELVSLDIANRESKAIQSAFGAKRELMAAGLLELGIAVDGLPAGGFYCWGDVSGLGPECNTGSSFLKTALASKTIVVPGGFFDINPGKRRQGRACRFGNFVRFSFGPPMQEVQLGLAQLGAALSESASA